MRYRIIAVVIAAVLALGIAGSILVLNAPAGDTVRIISNGKVVRTVALSSAADEVFDIEYDGHVNTVEIEDHRIRVLSADCPDQTCVKMGWLTSSAAPIVCLPHRLVIEFASDGSGPDAVTR